jgi:hypothetical protein
VDPITLTVARCRRGVDCLKVEAQVLSSLIGRYVIDQMRTYLHRLFSAGSRTLKSGKGYA